MNIIKKNAFTLVELLAVIVILAIILAIAIPGISGIITSATKGSFESDAKMLLKAINYKKLEVDEFDPTSVDKSTLGELLGLPSNNYLSINVVLEGDIPVISIIGDGKWDGLIACGTYKNMRIVENATDCSHDNVFPRITLLGDNPTNMYINNTYTDGGVIATDNIDGDLISDLIITSNVNPNVPGVYIVTYSVTDSSGNETVLTRTVNVIDVDYVESKGVNKPKLAIGMTPVKWDTTTVTWVNTTESDNDWYNYTTIDEKWANAKTEDGSLWVWIPRYVYKIPAVSWHASTVGSIDIQFTKGVDDNWNKAVIGNIDAREGAEASNAGTNGNKYTNHPAFTFGPETELTGIWVGKFEASGTTSAIKFVPNVASLRNQTIDTFFTSSRNMETNAMYGWGTTGTNIDTHMIKNSEWGAVSYLAQSVYGKNAEIWINNSSTYTTGCAGSSVTATLVAGCANAYNTTNGLQASTTGNIYGIYDMSGGAWEFTTDYVDNGHTNLNNGSTILAADNKYKDVYTKATIDNEANNYALALNKKGDALYETSASGTGSTSWNVDFSNMPRTDQPWFIRSGSYGSDLGAGGFNFYFHTGAANSGIGFHAVLLVGTGL